MTSIFPMSLWCWSWSPHTSNKTLWVWALIFKPKKPQNMVTYYNGYRPIGSLSIYECPLQPWHQLNESVWTVFSVVSRRMEMAIWLSSTRFIYHSITRCILNIQYPDIHKILKIDIIIPLARIYLYFFVYRCRPGIFHINFEMHANLKMPSLYY